MSITDSFEETGDSSAKITINITNIRVRNKDNNTLLATAPSGLYKADGGREQLTATNPTIIHALTEGELYSISSTEVYTSYLYLIDEEVPGNPPFLAFASS